MELPEVVVPQDSALPLETNEGSDSRRTVNIKMLDVLYDDQICSLIYMTDLTKLIDDGKEKQL